MGESGFPETALGDLFRLQRGTVAPASSPNEEFVHFSLPSFDETGTGLIERGAAIESAKTEIVDKCVLVSKLNPRKPRVLVADPANDPRRHCASTEFIAYVPRSDDLDVGYFCRLLGSSVFQRRLERVATGTTNSHVRARPPETLGWRVPHPPLPEQRQIAAILDTLDEAIRKTEAIIVKLKQVKQGLLHDLLTRGIDDSGELRDPERHPEQFKDSPLGRIPKEYVLHDLGECLAHVIDYRGRTPRKLGMEWGGTIPALSAMNVKMGKIDLTRDTYYGSDQLYYRWMTSGDCRSGDVLITMEAPLGKVAQVPDDRRYVLSQRVVLLRFDESLLLNDFAAVQMRSNRFQSNLVRWSTGTTATGIQRAKLVRVPMLVPPITEQRAAAAAVYAMDSRTDAEAREVEKLRLLKQGLMEDLLTGRVRVTELLEEAAE